MITLHPNILEKDGEKEFAVLPYDEFVKLQEELDDFEDLKALRHAKQREADAPTIPLLEVAKALGL